MHAWIRAEEIVDILCRTDAHAAGELQLVGFLARTCHDGEWTNIQFGHLVLRERRPRLMPLEQNSISHLEDLVSRTMHHSALSLLRLQCCALLILASFPDDLGMASEEASAELSSPCLWVGAHRGVNEARLSGARLPETVNHEW